MLTGLDSSVSFAAGPALYFALAMVATAVMFLGVGAVTSQLAATRRQAATYGAVFLGVAYAVRMIADAGVGLHWLLWVSPLGWVEELQPLTDPRPLVLLPIAGLTGALALSGRYTWREGAMSGRVSSPTGPSRDPGSACSAGRQAWPSASPDPPCSGGGRRWPSSGLLYGLIAKSAGATIAGSSVHTVFSKLGATGHRGRGGARRLFLVIAVLVALVGAGQLTAARSEEAAGRLDQLLALPLSRGHWLGGRLSAAVSALVVSGVVAGFFAWVGASTQDSGVGLATLLGAGVNVIPPAVVILGVGVLAFGLAPRSTSTVVYGYLGWSLLVVIVGGFGAADHWILDTSVFHQMASAPARPPNWSANAVMVLLGGSLALSGGVAFGHRDVEGA